MQYKNQNSNAKKVLLTVDLSVDVIQYAIKDKIGLIISRYGLFSSPIRSFSDVLVNKLYLLSKSPVSVYTLGEPFSAAENGIYDTICSNLFLNNAESFSMTNEFGKLSIGKVCSPQLYPNQTSETFQLKHLIQRAKNSLESQIVLYVGELSSKIEKIAIIGTEYVNVDTLIRLNKLNVDCLVSAGILGQMESIFCKDLKLSVVTLTLYNCIKKALEKLQTILSLEFPRQEFFLYDSKNPYNLANFEGNVLVRPELELKNE